MLRPVGAPNFAYGDPDLSTNWIVSLADSTAAEGLRPMIRYSTVSDGAGGDGRGRPRPSVDVPSLTAPATPVDLGAGVTDGPARAAAPAPAARWAGDVVAPPATRPHARAGCGSLLPARRRRRRPVRPGARRRARRSRAPARRRSPDCCTRSRAVIDSTCHVVADRLASAHRSSRSAPRCSCSPPRAARSRACTTPPAEPARDHRRDAARAAATGHGRPARSARRRRHRRHDRRRGHHGGRHRRHGRHRWRRRRGGSRRRRSLELTGDGPHRRVGDTHQPRRPRAGHRRGAAAGGVVREVARPLLALRHRDQGREGARPLEGRGRCSRTTSTRPTPPSRRAASWRRRRSCSSAAAAPTRSRPARSSPSRPGARTSRPASPRSGCAA